MSTLSSFAQAPEQAGAADREAGGLAAEGVRSNFLTTGVRVSGSWDDNALNVVSGTKVQDELVTLEPHIHFGVTRPRTTASFDYSPTFTFSQEVEQYNTRSQVLSDTFDYRVTRRLTLNTYDTFSISTTAYDQFRASNLTGTVPITVRPNDSSVVPGIRRLTGVAGLGGSYELDARNSLSISGSFNANRYHTPPNSGILSLVNATALYGTVDFEHRVSLRRSIGGSYTAQQIWSGGVSVLTHTVMYSERYNFGARRSLLLEAGPQYSTSVADLFVSTPLAFISRGNTVSWSAAGTLDLPSGRNLIEFSAARQVSDGGGLASVVRLARASVDVTRQFSKSWTGRIGGSYNFNDVLAGIAQQKQFRYWAANASLSRAVTRSVAIEVAYWRSGQSANALTPALAGYIEHNRVSVSVLYDVTRPLGK